LQSPDFPLRLVHPRLFERVRDAPAPTKTFRQLVPDVCAAAITSATWHIKRGHRREPRGPTDSK
jgi:hypothetical protein